MIENFTENDKELLNSQPLYSQEENANPLALMKFNNIIGRGTWYVIESEKQENGDYLFFGYVKSPLTSLYDEYGYFTLNELKSVDVIFREKHFTPRPIKELIG